MSMPSWITRETFQKVLASYFKANTVDVVSFTSKGACGAGENYTSDIFRTTITFRKNRGDVELLSVIVKCNSADGSKRTLAEVWNLFDKEVEMYKTTLPVIHSLLKEESTISSNCYYTSLTPHALIIMEDLSESGYNMLSRQLGFNLEISIKVMEKMAKLHAGSILAYKKNPGVMKSYSTGLHNDADELVRKWVKNGFSALADACLTWPGFEQYGQKLKMLGDQAMERGFQASKRKPGGFHVLNHGDTWVNNILIKFGLDKSVADVKFIDFQMAIFTSPAIDLHFYISSSPDTNVKLDHLDLLLDIYYSHLIVNLSRLHYTLNKVPTREEFLKDVYERSFFGLMVAVTVVPFVKADKREDGIFDNIFIDTPFRHHVFNNDIYRQHIQCLLPFYDNFGILD
uniref:Uncharacterized protein LOC114334274 n=1 Tax=Diabrotica virgifera virgifera TaxID=50390 RepID=A0A6P7G6H9_DIAVI